jgi:magnesium transporter
LKGLLKIEDVLVAPGDDTVSRYIDADPPVAKHGVDQEVAAWKAVQHGEGALAVVDDDGQFLGLIPPQRLLAVLLAEHDEDMARVGGFLRGSAGARQASLEPTHLRLWHRLPWLFVGLLGAIVAAVIVNGFEDQLREEVLLAFFLPGVVYLADAVGTQTEALIIRGLSAGVNVRDVVIRELTTGLVAGTLLGAAFFPIGLLWWHDADVVLAVSLSLFLACSVATGVATALPWLFNLAGQDPAFGSGPLATVIQDLLSIVLYLSVATLLI